MSTRQRISTRPPDPLTLALLVEIDRARGAGRTASIGSAAHALGIAQPNASRMISLYEEDLGFPLLERSPRGSRLTERGAALAAWAAEVVDGYDHLLSGTEALRAGLTATLQVSASMTVAEHLLPGWLERFRTRHPEVQVGLTVENSAAVVDHLRTGARDLGFVESAPAPEGVEYTTVGEDSLQIAVAAHHPLARRYGLPAASDHPAGGDGMPPRRLSGEQLAALPLLVREEGSGTRGVVEDALDGFGGLVIAQELGSNAACKVAATAGLAPVALSRVALADAVRSGDLVVLAVDPEVDLSRNLRAVWAPGSKPSALAADFVSIALGRPLS
ncbi:LysR family transcriptional regulator [Brevibacterium litoralis]|uniref:LysR family transcriptional regulator n=1 Tax=Brevibacterium litoralis TaxID=3138935 RepID=UPI0032EE9169